jgi:hypothetical protein
MTNISREEYEESRSLKDEYKALSHDAIAHIKSVNDIRRRLETELAALSETVAKERAAVRATLQQILKYPDWGDRVEKLAREALAALGDK